MSKPWKRTRLTPAADEASLAVTDFHGANLVVHIEPPQGEEDDPHITAVFAKDSDENLVSCVNLADLWDYIDPDELAEAFEDEPR